MSSVEVAPVSLPKETERFVRTWASIYRDDPCWVPPLYFERKQFFDPDRNPYFENAQVAYFIATRGGRDVGGLGLANLVCRRPRAAERSAALVSRKRAHREGVSV